MVWLNPYSSFFSAVLNLGLDDDHSEVDVLYNWLSYFRLLSFYWLNCPKFLNLEGLRAFRASAIVCSSKRNLVTPDLEVVVERAGLFGVIE